LKFVIKLCVSQLQMLAPVLVKKATRGTGSNIINAAMSRYDDARNGTPAGSGLLNNGGIKCFFPSPFTRPAATYSLFLESFGPILKAQIAPWSGPTHAIRLKILKINAFLHPTTHNALYCWPLLIHRRIKNKFVAVYFIYWLTTATTTTNNNTSTATANATTTT
jgi:hypothetical protein